MPHVGRWGVAAVPLVLVPTLGAVQGGFAPNTWVWSGALAAWAAAVGTVLADSFAVPARAWAWVAASAALLGWTIVSATWSAHPAQSVLEARRMIVYVSVALAIAVLARRGAASVLVVATHAAISGLVLYALGRYLLGARQVDAFEGPLLNQPLGYANAVGILSTLGLLLGIGIVARSGARSLRAAAAATVPLLALALVLTKSDASVLALAAGIGVVALLERSPLSLARALVLITPGAFLTGWLGHHSGLAVGVAAPHPSAHVLALAALACSVGTGALAALVPTRRITAGRRLVAAGVACAALAAVALAARAGTRQPRKTYWHVAWHEYLAHPILGSGAGTFAHFWVQSGEAVVYGGALDAHSLYLETLAELGPIGLAILVVFLALPLQAALAHRDAAYVPAAAGAYVAFLLHAGLEWDWEMPAVMVAALACAGALVLDDEAPERTPTTRVRIALAAACLALGVLSIAGGRSHTVPGAAPRTMKAPQVGAFIHRKSLAVSYGLLW
jgi:O-antigen ligase/polysaccharide polymerase Wzy-like membrane protein